ncbi:MAG: MgtC/SapB family protein [Planctomycetes bacterium]|nr:MgtC/SapB family protein [Planctomycetota bacterium]
MTLPNTLSLPATLVESAQSLLAFPEASEWSAAMARLLLAAVLGAVLGVTRQHLHKAAGLRTHMLVALGSAVTVVTASHAGMSSADTSRIIQGVVAGIGFLGAGTILKADSEQHVQGLTTAASVWTTAAIGVAAGIAPLWLPVAGAALAWFILGPLGVMERRLQKTSDK